MADQRIRLGKQIKAARDGKQWKQKELAAAVNVEPTTVSRWERGQHAPDIDLLEMIAKATEKPLSFFVDSAVTPADPGELAALRPLLERAIELLETLVEPEAPLRTTPRTGP